MVTIKQNIQHLISEEVEQISPVKEIFMEPWNAHFLTPRSAFFLSDHQRTPITIHYQQQLKKTIRNRTIFRTTLTHFSVIFNGSDNLSTTLSICDKNDVYIFALSWISYLSQILKLTCDK